jgi:hypothetical protein
MSQKQSTTVTIDTRIYTGVLTLLFVALKLSGAVDWSWWWVLSPLWIGIALGLLILLVMVGIKAVRRG